MFLDKKGDAKTVRNLLLLLIVAVILISFTIKFGAFLYSEGNREACYNWAVLQSSKPIGKVPVLGTKGVEFQSPCITTSEVIKTNKEEEIYEQLAQNMYLCWDQYGEGKIDFYSNWDWGAANTHCRICSEIKINNKITRDNIDIDEFEGYLSNNNPPTHEETYAEYFLGTENAQIDFGSGKLEFDKEIPFYTVFSIVKHKRDGIVKPTAIAAGTCAVGISLGAKIGVILAPFTGGVSIPTVAGIGCILGVASSGIAYYGGSSEVLYPTILLFSEKKAIDEGCDDIYYNPQKSVLNFDKGDSEE